MSAKIAQSRPRGGEAAFQAFNYALLGLLSLAFIVPFLAIVSTSFVGESELIRRGNFILVPEKLDFSAYRVLLSEGSMLYHAYGVTILRVVVGTLLNLVFTAMLAYGLSRKEMPGRNVLITLVFITMLFGGGLIPTYLLLKFLHLTDTFWVMIVPGLISAWNMLIMKNFFGQIPESLIESATLDGASPIAVLARIVFPLSLPTFATIGLFYAVGHWNAWFDATIYVNDPNLMPVQVLLRRIVLSFSSQDLDAEMLNGVANKPTAQSLRGAMIVVTTLPILCVYPFLQKHFVKGVLTGSLKG
ncbi:carbohydrate ABC transporter permease [Paenibacillus flagellatus]|uniref:Carbohydrate ABC transporter permease n=1 Tax=Paenibacillus flagellatus TaxID=2211139 RepID=A0A2V5KPN4_9BACL|nr:carbohydrate ABC transporter permease [Paenibacillus flagellatus]PYI57470.1 carbohydrate ABC transporter permease [Paenibacillus flagellatus]